jgi:hypothetical protein
LVIAAGGSQRRLYRRRRLLLFCRVSPCRQRTRAGWHCEELTGCEAMFANNTNPQERTAEKFRRHFGGLFREYNSM